MTEKTASIRWQRQPLSGLAAWPLDDGRVLDKSSLFACLISAFDFPDYFGGNWDAAYDLLLDALDALDDQVVSRIWCFSIGTQVEVNQQELVILIGLLSDVCDYANARQQVLQVLIQSEREDLAALQGLELAD